MCGLACKAVTIIVLIALLTIHIEYLASGKGQSVYSMVREDYFDAGDEFKQEQGFNFAVALIDPNQAALVDPRYVTLNVRYLNWETNEYSGVRNTHFESLLTH